ncbi:MAG: CHAT domain-containing protein, partial [Acidobacteriota bacterium]
MRRRHQEHPSRSDADPADPGTRVELTLTLTPGPEGAATVHATSPEGAAQGRFALPTDVLRDDSTASAQAGARHVTSAEGTERSPLDSREVGARLFEALFADPGVHGLYESTRAAATPERLRLRIVVDPDGPSMEAVHALPWELLHDRDRGERLACEGGVSIVRSLAVRRPPRPFVPRKTVRVLVLLSGATDLDLERERGLMEELARRTAGLEVTCETASDLATLEELLARAAEGRYPFHVLHLAGHGEIAAGPEGGVLPWEPTVRPRSTISGRNLSALLRRFPELRMVVLNACTTADLPGDGRDPFAGVAAALFRGGAPVVVGVRGAIRDDAAVRFAETFYQRLAGGRAPEECMRAARWALWIDRPEGVEWAKPVLFQAATERRVGLPRWLVRAAAGLTAALVLLAAFALRQRRALELRELERGLAAAVTDLTHTRPDAARRTLESALDRLPFP